MSNIGFAVKVAQEASKEGVAKAAEPLLVRFALNLLAGDVLPAILGAVLKEVVGMMLGHLLSDLANEANAHINNLHSRVDAVEKRLEDRWRQAADLLQENTIKASQVSPDIDAATFEYLCDEVRTSSVVLQIELKNYPQLPAPEHLRVLLLQAFAALLQPGGAFQAKEHLNAALMILADERSALQGEIEKAIAERFQPRIRYKRVEIVKYMPRGEAYVGTSRYTEVPDGFEPISTRNPSLIEPEIAGCRQFMDQLCKLHDAIRLR